MFQLKVYVLISCLEHWEICIIFKTFIRPGRAKNQKGREKKGLVSRLSKEIMIIQFIICDVQKNEQETNVIRKPLQMPSFSVTVTTRHQTTTKPTQTACRM